MTTKMVCRRCGRSALAGVWLERVNPIGEPGIWECRPSCDANMAPDDAVVRAVLGPDRAVPAPCSHRRDKP